MLPHAVLSCLYFSFLVLDGAARCAFLQFNCIVKIVSGASVKSTRVFDSNLLIVATSILSLSWQVTTFFVLKKLTQTPALFSCTQATSRPSRRQQREA